VLSALGDDPVPIDTLVERMNIALPELQRALLDLELAGRVASAPGGRFQRIHRA
jgi:DNA processing protein